MATNPVFTAPARRLSLIALIISFIAGSDLTTVPIAHADQEDNPLIYLKSLSIEELIQTRITSVSKKSEQLFSVAAAVTVVTQEDIQRAGVHSIPEALRLVPGLQVAQIDGSRYAISARGFNEFFANKLLVLIDGRSIYTPLFSGVNWNAEDTLIEDIDRIEVIRGPGATVWGANAVNGVINIITKHSENTQGGIVSTVIGTHDQPMVSTRYGGRIDDDTTYRLFAKGFQRESLDSPEGGDANDSWESLRTGFRLDRSHSDNDTVSLQAEIYDNEADATADITGYAQIVGTEVLNGGHLIANWEHRLNNESALDFQFYYDHSQRDLVIASETRDTIDLEFKHHWQPQGAHDIVWGSGYRWTADNIQGTFPISFSPDSRADELWSAFVQDDINIIEDKIWVTIGTKFEHNDYSGFEIQPSIRLRYKPAEKQIIWAAVSHAVRTPARSDHNLVANLGTVPLGGDYPVLAQMLGDERFDSENVVAYEVGYRLQPHENLSLDLATYYNVYEDIRSLDPDLLRPWILYFGNSSEGITYGFELQATWQATRNLKVSAAYTFLDIDLTNTYPLTASASVSEEALSPEHQFQIRSYLDLPHDISLDTEIYFVDTLGKGSNHIDPYLRFDLQISWQPKDSFRLSLGAENLFNSSHQEFFNRQNLVASEVPQQFWLKAAFTF
jgi:iron complex outermembrane receptor protein